MSDIYKKGVLDEVIEGAEKYVTFNIGGEVYGIEVLRVHEILGMTKITHVPNSMHFMKGMINLRGNVVPVIDMRLKFNLPGREYNELTVILIVEVKERLLGMIVDTVSDVITMPAKSIQATPHFSSSIETDFIKGIGNNNDELIIVLEIDKILTYDELEKLDEKKTA